MRIDLRPELLPPPIDPEKLAWLIELANRIDGADPDECADDLAVFSLLVGGAVPFDDLQEVWRGESYEQYIPKLIYQHAIVPVADLTRAEMAEIVLRTIHGREEADFYWELFHIYCRHPSGSDLIYRPNLVPELPQDREPTAEEIADLALRGPA